MTWLAAIGGNFQESLDKMLIIAAPGFIWKVVSAYFQPAKEMESEFESPLGSPNAEPES